MVNQTQRCLHSNCAWKTAIRISCFWKLNLSQTMVTAYQHFTYIFFWVYHVPGMVPSAKNSTGHPQSTRFMPSQRTPTRKRERYASCHPHTEYRTVRSVPPTTHENNWCLSGHTGHLRSWTRSGFQRPQELHQAKNSFRNKINFQVLQTWC